MAGLALESYVDKPEPAKPVDREKTCPLLLRVFCCTGRHNNLMDYNRNGVPSNELQIYTWMDATLRELADLIRGVNADADKNGTTFDFCLVTHDVRPNGAGFRMRNIGSTVYGTKGSDDTKTLSQCRFTIGDYMDVCIHPPSSRMGGGGGGPMMRRGRPQY